MKSSLRRLPVMLFVIACAAGTGVYRAVDGDLRTETELELVLNIAGNRLDVYEHGERTHTYKVSVGMRGHETPTGDYRIRDITWNPWWHPPNSAWARDRKPEPPGEKNPMGRVKMNFAPLLYIHGTPDYQSLGQPASHGCVRMRNADAIELAQLVHRYGTPKLDRSVLDKLIDSPTQTRRYQLTERVRFTAHYRVAGVHDGFLIIYPDPYERVGEQLREEVEAVLSENGVDPQRVNQERFRRLLSKGGRTRVAMSLDSLVAVADGTPASQGGAR